MGVNRKISMCGEGLDIFDSLGIAVKVPPAVALLGCGSAIAKHPCGTAARTGGISRQIPVNPNLFGREDIFK
jgi:hypothetical protein